MSTFDSQDSVLDVLRQAQRFEWIDDLRVKMPTMHVLTKEMTAELVSELFTNWVQGLRLAIGDRAGGISVPEASELLSIIHCVLDALEEASDRRNERFPDVLDLLHPIDDFLTFLELIVLGQRPRPRRGQRPTRRSTLDDRDRERG